MNAPTSSGRPGARVLVLTFLLAVAVYLPTVGHYFVSDDFLNFERNDFRSIAQAVGFLSTTDIDFYRPIPRLHFGILQILFQDRTWIWNLIGMVLHGLTAVAAARLARSLVPHAPRAAAACGLLFAVHFIHVEPVMWASGVTSVYVTLFLLLALIGFRRARETGETRHRTVSVVALAAALMSKETAVAFAPLLLLTTWWRPPRAPDGSRTPRFPTPAEVVPYAVLFAAWALVFTGIERGGDESPYRLAFGGHIVKNAVFFVMGGFVPLRFWKIRDLWAAEGGGAGFAGALFSDPLLGVPLVLGAAAVAAAVWRGGRDVRASFAWIPAAALPFLFLPGSGERFLYLPSFGACLALGLGLDALARAARFPGGRAGRAAVVAAGLTLMALGQADRQRDWRTASSWTRGIVHRWAFLQHLPADRPIEFIGIPDSYRSAWVFRNGFDSVVRMYWQGRPYALEGRLPPDARDSERMMVVLKPGGTVGMSPPGS